MILALLVALPDQRCMAVVAGVVEYLGSAAHKALSLKRQEVLLMIERYIRIRCLTDTFVRSIALYTVD
jgi:hypothetical protein